MPLPVVYQNQFNSVYIRGYCLPSVIPGNEDDYGLSTQEHATLSAITSPTMHHQKTWSFILTRMVLGEILRQDPKTFDIDRAGKPTVSPAAQPTVYFNVSHSANLWIIAWSFDQEVGIDVQKIDESIHHNAIMRQFFTTSERAQVNTVFDFFDIWTQKEATLKLHGLSFAHMQKISTNNATLIPLEITPDFKAHLAVETR